MNKKYLFFTAAILLVGISLAFAFNGKNDQNELAGDSTTLVENTAAPAEDFKWYSINEALSMNKVSGKKIFIDTYTTWCGPCKMLDANTFSNPTIRKLLNEYYIPTKFNAESGDTIEFAGKTYTNPRYSPSPRVSTHQFAIFIASTQSGLGYPTMVFLNENLERIDAIAGYLTPSQLEPILVYYGSGVNETQDWPTFLSTFKSEITQ